jgi:sulfate adenylyltransferase
MTVSSSSNARHTTLIAPYGGRLVDLVVHDEASKAEWQRRGHALPALQLSARSLCDLELLATGAFSPLDRFMGQDDYWHVLRGMRLASGVLFPIPITLPVPAEWSAQVDTQVALRDQRNNLLALMQIEERYPRDYAAECLAVAGTLDPAHPLVAEMASWGEHAISGTLTVVALPMRAGFPDLRLTPSRTRARLAEMSNPRVVAFQTRNPVHRAHEALTKRACAETSASLLLHPTVGLTQPGDVDVYTRVRCYRALVAHHYDPGQTLLSVIPLAMRMAGPREAVWHALIRRNYGASHFIVGRDHAGPGRDTSGRPFYPPQAAQELAVAHQAELGITVLASEELVYVEDRDDYVPASQAVGLRTRTISGTEARENFLREGRALPAWFTRPEISAVLHETYIPRHRQGICVWLTGLSGAGKTAIAEALTDLLLETGRQVTLLDGDVVRTHLSKGLGFSRADRDANVLRIGFVASEIVRHHGLVICAAVSPYETTRSQVRDWVGADHFILVHVATDLEVCEARDVKGLYQRARRGEVVGVTGIDDPYETPLRPDLLCDGGVDTPEYHAQTILNHLRQLGLIRRWAQSGAGDLFIGGARTA